MTSDTSPSEKSPGDRKLLALQKPDRVYEEFPLTDEGIKAAQEFLAKAAHGGTIYVLEYYEDKYGDIVAKSIPVVP